MAGVPPVLPAQLVGNEVLFRALRNKAQQNDKRLAFLLRNDERDTGLSVSYNCTADDCENEFNKTYGVLSLIAQQVANSGLGLTVVPDAATHANITGIPHSDDDPNRAMFIAGQLSGFASTVREGLRYQTT